MSHSQLLVLFLLTVQSFSILAAKNIINMISVLTIWCCPCLESSLVLLEEGVCYVQCILLVELCQPLPCFILYSKAKFACYSKCFLTSYFCIPVPYNEKDIFLGVSSRRSCRSSQNCSTSASSALLVGAQTWITMILNGSPWKRTVINLSFLRLHPNTAFLTLLLTMMATPFLLRDSSLQQQI